jgi:hypothetical protein
MKALSPVLVVSAANTLISRDCGPDPRKFRGEPGVSRASALLVNHVGYQAHKVNHFSNWPFRLTSTCDEMARQASRDGALHTLKPEAGEIFLKWSFRGNRFIGAGIVLDAWDRPRLSLGWGFRLRLCLGSARLVDEQESPYRHSVVDWAMVIEMETVPKANGDRFIAWADADRRDPSQVRPARRDLLLPFRPAA